MSKFTSTLVGALVLVALAGCSDNLVVMNPNSPDEARALARPTDVENLVGAAFRTINNYTDGDVLRINAQLLCAGMENYSGLANAGMGPACAIPRPGVDNSRGNQTLSEKYQPYLNIYQAVRSVALGLNRLNDPAFTFYPTSIPQQQRDRAFAYFEIGVGLGDIAMVYDSGAAVAPNDDPQVVKPLEHYTVLGPYALAQLDSAIAIATASGTGFPLPDTWINGNALTAAQFIALARSWKARIRAGLARTPADRAAVDWAQVIADAAAGITANFTINMRSSAPAWTYRPAQMDLFADWHQMWQFIVGMADTSGAYSAWLGTAVTQRSPFLVITPDLRFPQGTTRAAQNTASGCTATSCTPPRTDIFFRNRPSGTDVPSNPLGFSMYDFYRFNSVLTASPPRTGPVPVVTVAEMNLLRAEGLIRTGNIPAAAALISISRTAHGLPSVAAMTDTLAAVPGGNACVPKVPQPPAYTSAACGNLFDALRWEKRMETAYTHWGAWWIDGRGWGELPANTPLQYPVPYQELDTRREPSYTYSTGAAGKWGL